jgi:hypothetical protein
VAILVQLPPILAKLATVFAELLLGFSELSPGNPDELTDERFLPVEAATILPARERGELRGDALALGGHALLGLEISQVVAAIAPVVPQVLAVSRTHLTVVPPHLCSVLGELAPGLEPLGLQVRAKPLIDVRKAPPVVPEAGASQVGQDGLELGQVAAVVAKLTAVLTKLALVRAFLGTVGAVVRLGGRRDEEGSGN